MILDKKIFFTWMNASGPIPRTKAKPTDDTRSQPASSTKKAGSSLANWKSFDCHLY